MRTLLIMAGLFAAGVCAAKAETAEPSPAPLKCDTGPVQRTFGGTIWIVYSCDDLASMVVVSRQGNPASPFVFFLKPDSGTYLVSGEGNGEKKASDAASYALAKMTPLEFAALLAATKATVTKP